LGLWTGDSGKARHGSNDFQVEECVMPESTLIWGLLIASVTNALCLCTYLDRYWPLGPG